MWDKLMSDSVEAKPVNPGLMNEYYHHSPLKIWQEMKRKDNILTLNNSNCF